MVHLCRVLVTEVGIVILASWVQQCTQDSVVASMRIAELGIMSSLFVPRARQTGHSASRDWRQYRSCTSRPSPKPQQDEKCRIADAGNRGPDRDPGEAGALKLYNRHGVSLRTPIAKDCRQNPLPDDGIKRKGCSPRNNLETVPMLSSTSSGENHLLL